MLTSPRVVTAALAVLLGTLAVLTIGAPTIYVSPTHIVVNKTAGNTTLSFYPLPYPYTKLFLVKKDFANCSQPPPESSTNIRTKVLTLTPDHTVSFQPWRLDEGTYEVCFNNRTAFATYFNQTNVTRWANFTLIYTGFSKMVGVQISISHPLPPCSADQTHAAGVCKVTPTFANGREDNSTFQLLYAPAGTRVFLMKRKQHGINIYNCTSPPPMDSGLRTPEAIVGQFSFVKIDTLGLKAGSYVFCVFNSTFKRLPWTVAISGAIDAARSVVSCCEGPFTVGQRTYCQINAYDALGNPAGGERDACEFRVCPLTDGRGDAVTDYVEPYYVQTGLYEFYFTATGSGCSASAGAAYQGRTLGGNQVNFFRLTPTTEEPTAATSDCSWSEGLTTCNVTRRDSYNNPISTCHILSTGTLYCTPSP